MQLIGVQLDIAWEDREANFSRVRELLDAQPPRPGALVALPEMFASGFSMNVARIAEDASRPTQRFLCDLARQYGCTIVGGMAAVARDGRGANLAVVATPRGEIAATYSKLHPY